LFLFFHFAASDVAGFAGHNDGADADENPLERSFLAVVHRTLGGSLAPCSLTTNHHDNVGDANDSTKQILEMSFFSIGGNSLNVVAVCLALNDAGLPISEYSIL
jgi:hypothetical protein